MVKRYWVNWEKGCVEPKDNGEYVLTYHYHELAERCERLEAALRVLADYPLEDFMQEGKPDERELFGANDWHLRVGDVKRARAILSGGNGGKA